LLREVRRLRARIQVLEDEIDVMRTRAVEVVAENWQRNERYARLVNERNRMRAHIANLEDRLSDVRRD
jgi:cell division protein FtsB